MSVCQSWTDYTLAALRYTISNLRRLDFVKGSNITVSYSRKGLNKMV